MNGVRDEFRAALQEGEFDEDGNADEVRSELVEQFHRGGCGAAVGTADRPWASIFSTARSRVGSTPRILASRILPSWRRTRTRRAPMTTWAFVAIRPDESRMKPAPPARAFFHFLKSTSSISNTSVALRLMVGGLPRAP